VKALERMDMIEEVVDDTAAVNFRFTFSQQPGRYIVSLNNVSKAYGPVEILKHTSISLEKTDKIALIGANGRGKSTLLRILAGEEPVEGERVMGFNVIKAFFAQHQLESLRVENEILEELVQAGSKKTEQQLRNVLGCFLFSDEDVFKKIKVLSGGEKSRVALAKTLISEANFLLLDEPTNHLDFISENILIQALQQYKGSFVVVSHNRHFVSQIANKIWYIEDKQIKEYPGTYDEYEYWRKKNEENAVKAEPPKAKKAETPKPAFTPTEEAKRKTLEKDLKKVEDQLNSLEKQKADIQAEMAKPAQSNDFALLQKLQEEINTLQKSIDAVTKKWEEIAMAIDEVS
jgi:ATP-binding cassette, subfamily F, member 3